MDSLMRGKLTHHQPSAEYEGHVFTWQHAITLPDGMELPIFDPTPSIGYDLTPDQTYTVVVSALLPRDARFHTAAEAASAPPPTGWWRGVVRDLAWQLPTHVNEFQGETADNAQVNFPRIRTERADALWTLVETEHGLLVLSSSRVQHITQGQEARGEHSVDTSPSLQPGDVIDWEPLRFDLMAVY